MVRITKRLILFDRTGKKVWLPQPGTAAGLDMLTLLPSRLQELYSGRVSLKVTGQEAPSKTGKCLFGKEGEYARAIQRLDDTELWNLSATRRKKSKEYPAFRKLEAKIDD